MRKALTYLLCGITGVLVGLFASKLCIAFVQYDKSASFYEAVSADVVKDISTVKGDVKKQDTSKAVVPWYKQISVDLESLQSENSDIIGWIYFENVDISYPIVHSDNNDDYLYQLYSGEDNQAGEELVRWRQVLIKYLPPEWAEGLRQDIFNNTSRCFEGEPAYDSYVNWMYQGVDPQQEDSLTDRMQRLANGTDETSITYL